MPFSQFTPADARAKILSLRVQRPPNPALEMPSSDETVNTADGAFRVRVLSSEGNDWRASPIVAKSYAGLPTALVVTADHDPLVDAGQLYADRLTAEGVTAEHTRDLDESVAFVSHI